jgi:hypothetical protein
MNENNKELCPLCNNHELGWGRQSGEGKVYPTDAIFSNGSAIYHLICKECGHILRSKVEKPHKFK